MYNDKKKILLSVVKLKARWRTYNSQDLCHAIFNLLLKFSLEVDNPLSADSLEHK